MEYLIRCKCGNEVYNFIFDEEKAKRFLIMAYTHVDKIKMIKLYGDANMSEKELFVHFIKKNVGGYVADRYGNLEFNFNPYIEEEKDI